MKTKTKIILFVALIITGFYFLTNRIMHDSGNTGFSNNSSENKLVSGGAKALYNAEIEFQKTRNPETDQVPANIRAHELAFALTIPANEQSDRKQNWIHRGPVNMGGRMLCLAFDVGDENHMLAGSASGGMWQTMNQGDSWL